MRSTKSALQHRPEQPYNIWWWMVAMNRHTYMHSRLWPLPVGPEPWERTSLPALRLAASYLGDRLVGGPFR